MFKRECTAAKLVLVLILVAGVLPAQETERNQKQENVLLKNLSLEQLASVEIISVGRKGQEAISSPAALGLVTSDDIHRSGVQNISEALRFVNGLHVARFNNVSYPFSARGFNITTANKMQVFMDGRSLYTPLFGGVFSDTLDTFMDDVDRIEVVRGPGATLWGGNAVNGVINVITKDPRETQGTVVVAGLGTQERGFAGLRYGGHAGQKTFYRIYGKFLDRDSLFLNSGPSAKDEFAYGQSGFVLDSEINTANSLRVQGDLYSGKNGLRDRDDIGIHGGNLLTRWTHTFRNGSELKVQSYFDRTSRLVPGVFDEIRDTYDLDMQHRFEGLSRNDIVWGLGYRASNDQTKPQEALFFDPSGRNLALLNFFAEDDITLRDSLHLIVGAKIEHNSYTDWEIYPTARLVWTVNNRHTWWGAVSRAVRIPTQFDRDLRLGAAGTVFIRGDSKFRAEQLVAYEVGYRSLLTDRLSFGIALYYNDYDKLRSQEGPRDGGFPIVLSNNLRAKTYGAEINSTFNVLDWWRLRVSYNNQQKQLSFRPESTDITHGFQEASDPKNQFAFRSQMDLPKRTTLDFFVRYASALQLPPPAPPVKSYLVFDVSAGWQATEHLELSVVGRGLPDRRHVEFGPLGEQIPRDVYGILRWHF